MIIVSAGMPKAGSGWYFNLVNDMLVEAGGDDVRDVKRAFRMGAMLQWENCNIGKPTWAKLARVAVPHLLGKTFVVKTHAGPNRSLRAFMKLGVVRPTYIYRDPRAVALSAYEHGQRLRTKGRQHAFARLSDPETAILYARKLLSKWAAWAKLDGVYLVRYEDLKSDPANVLRGLARFGGIRVTDAQVAKVVASYSEESIAGDSRLQTALHFNRGDNERYRQVFTDRQLALCEEQFGSFLDRMGYAAS